MSDDWTTFNVKYFAVPMTALVLGLVIGFAMGDSSKPHKEYPVKVECYWQTNGYASYPTMECDSIKGDTVYKDGNSIVSKNIINVTFK
jgi:hypothetical protein